MKLQKAMFSFFIFAICTACGKGFQTGTNNAGVAGTTIQGENVMAVTVGCEYVNEPCVSVKICVPGTTQCQTINNVLLDTGSYGLRLFSSVVNLSLPQQQDSSGRSLAECVSYADGSSQWGPVKIADVGLAGEKALNVPIQIVNASFPGVPSDCTDLDTTPQTSGFNGILGVGLFTEDCGSGCVTNANNRLYFGCSGSTCTSTTVTIAKQVSNPVSFLPSDNNGVILQLPSISSSGAVSVSGSLILGIGTQSNNTFSNVLVFPADNSADFLTSFNGHVYDAFIDSGSNGLYFPGPSNLTRCSDASGLAGFFCPQSLMSFTATQMGPSQTPQEAVSFQIMNAEVAFSNTNPNWVFNDLGGQMDGTFDWGLPFFLGRTVFVGIENKHSNLGTGPYWAY
jgi:hypothetical protein